MKHNQFMEVFVNIKDNYELKSPFGSVNMIPFSGEIKSDFFHGKILPGAVDTQFTDANQVTHMSARYMAEGMDQAGNLCHLFVENEGCFSGGIQMPFQTIPKFWTDSNVLADYLHRNKFKGEGYLKESVLIIKFFEIEDDKT